MKIIEWFKTHILRRKPSNWIKKKLEISYWTSKEAEATIDIISLTFRGKTKPEPVHIDSIIFYTKPKEYPKIIVEP